MEGFWEVVLEALIDSSKILPILLAVYFLIELLEYKKAFEFSKSKLLKGKASPVIGALCGCVPQCGFSVITTDLFTKGSVSVGALIAVYLATSDEALPIMLSSPTHIPDLLLLLVFKLIFGICIGFLAIWLHSLLFKSSKNPSELEKSNTKCKINENSSNLVQQNKHNSSHNEQHKHELSSNGETESKINLEENHIGGCCHHNIESKSFDWLHPLVHCLKIFAFIFIINIILGVIIWQVGEENFANFLQSSYVFQPLLSVVIGLIPNCASSVVLTELYIQSSLSFGAIFAGLSVNSGVALILLFKQNKNWKENLFILAMLIIPSLIFGYILHFINIL